MGSGASKKEREKIKASLPSPPLLFIAFFTSHLSHRSPLSERLEQVIVFMTCVKNNFFLQEALGALDL